MKNEGNVDRIIRFFLGIIFFISAFFWFTGIVQIIFYILGTIMIFTAITGFCLVYLLFGISTYRSPKNKSKGKKIKHK
jgi:hypothetical protein